MLAKAGAAGRIRAMPGHPHTAALDFAERPFILFWEVTRACALACRHCRAVAQPQAHPQELTHEEALHLLDAIAELNPPMLVLTGGDPMMRRDIFELIRYGTEKGLRVSLSPAATARLLNTDFAELKAAGVVSMSLSLTVPRRPRTMHSAACRTPSSARWRLHAAPRRLASCCRSTPPFPAPPCRSLMPLSSS